MFKAVIFDRDGILLNSEEIHINSTFYALKKFGVKPDNSDKELIIGRHPSEYVSDFMSKYSSHNISQDDFRKFQKDFYYKHIDNAPLFNEAINLVKILHSEKIPLGLTTSSSKDNTIKFLDRTNLNTYFSGIVTHEDCKRGKPFPDPYLTTANKLNINPQDCIAIEDTAIGIDAAKNAGMKCIAIPNDYTKNQDFSRADMVVTSAKDITLDLLQKLAK
ncbi:MAG: HAD family hydrolase [Candidatus Nanoarchaeia archaeon]